MEDPHSDPPPDLQDRGPLLLRTDRGWYRSHRLDLDALNFGRTARNRFDDPDKRYGVLYVAEDEHGAFIETFGRVTGTRVVTFSTMSAYGLTRVVPDRALTLVNLADSGGLARLGADGRLCTGDRSVAQRWSRALRVHPAKPDGLYYPARHDPARHDPARRAAALFDHVTRHLTTVPLGPWLAPERSAMLGGILDTYQFGLIQDS